MIEYVRKIERFEDELLDRQVEELVRVVNQQLEALDTTLTGHIAATEAHGATGAVVGTTNTQIISNKTMDASNIYGGTGGQAVFEADGFLRFEDGGRGYDDVYPSSVTVQATGANAAAFTAYSGNLKAYEFVGTGVTPKELSIGYQFYHSYAEGVSYTPHVHLHIPDDATGGTIKLYCEFENPNVGDTGAVAVTTISGTVTRAANAGISKNHILSFGEVSGAGKKISHLFMTRVYRDPADVADTFGASVWLKSADIHILKDSEFSREPFTK